MNFALTDLNNIRDILIKKKQTLAVAESVTAGFLQSAFSMVENAKDYFHGGITTYNLGQKTKHLSVDPIHALSCDCVSEKVAITMALNVNRLFSSDWGIAITGYASPLPEKDQYELFAFYAIAFRDEIKSKGKIVAQQNDDPVAVREYFTNTLTGILKDTLKTL
jgi:nicotinamide-nucleotide amidase